MFNQNKQVFWKKNEYLTGIGHGNFIQRIEFHTKKEGARTSIFLGFSPVSKKVFFRMTGALSESFRKSLEILDVKFERKDNELTIQKVSKEKMLEIVDAIHQLVPFSDEAKHELESEITEFQPLSIKSEWQKNSFSDSDHDGYSWHNKSHPIKIYALRTKDKKKYRFEFQGAKLFNEKFKARCEKHGIVVHIFKDGDLGILDVEDKTRVLSFLNIIDSLSPLNDEIKMVLSQEFNLDVKNLNEAAIKSLEKAIDVLDDLKEPLVEESLNKIIETAKATQHEKIFWSVGQYCEAKNQTFLAYQLYGLISEDSQFYQRALEKQQNIIRQILSDKVLSEEEKDWLKLTELDLALKMRNPDQHWLDQYFNEMSGGNNITPQITGVGLNITTLIKAGKLLKHLRQGQLTTHSSLNLDSAIAVKHRELMPVSFFTNLCHSSIPSEKEPFWKVNKYLEHFCNNDFNNRIEFRHKKTGATIFWGFYALSKKIVFKISEKNENLAESLIGKVIGRLKSLNILYEHKDDELIVKTSNKKMMIEVLNAIHFFEAFSMETRLVLENTIKYFQPPAIKPVWKKVPFNDDTHTGFTWESAHGFGIRLLMLRRKDNNKKLYFNFSGDDELKFKFNRRVSKHDLAGHITKFKSNNIALDDVEDRQTVISFLKAIDSLTPLGAEIKQFLVEEFNLRVNKLENESLNFLKDSLDALDTLKMSLIEKHFHKIIVEAKNTKDEDVFWFLGQHCEAKNQVERAYTLYKMVPKNTPYYQQAIERQLYYISQKLLQESLSQNEKEELKVTQLTLAFSLDKPDQAWLDQCFHEFSGGGELTPVIDNIAMNIETLVKIANAIKELRINNNQRLAKEESSDAVSFQL